MKKTTEEVPAIVLLLIAFKMLFLDKKVKEIAIKNEKAMSSTEHPSS